MKHILFTTILCATFHSGQAFASDKPEQAKVFPNSDFAASSGTWDTNPYTYMIKETGVWPKAALKIDTSSLTYTHPFNTWPIADPYNYDELKSSDCGNKIIRGFEVNASTVYFTLGRSPEMCSNPPAMRWVDETGSPKEVILIPASNWNVVSFWQSGNYAVFGLDAQYEGGSSAETLGIWDFRTGEFNIVSVKKTDLGTELGNWEMARLATTDTAVILKTSLATVAFLPDRKKTSILSPAPRTKSQVGTNK